MRIKTFLIAALIIGAMTFPFMHNVMPVVAHSASPAALTATAAAAQGINPQASYGVQIMDFNPYSLLFGRNVLPGATHSAFPAALTATATVEALGFIPTSIDARITDPYPQYSLLSQGGAESQVKMYYKTDYCDEAWRFAPTTFNGSTVYQIKHSNNGTCLAVRGFDNGAIAQQVTCGTQWSDQLWEVIPVDPPGSGLYILLNVHSEKALCHGGLAPVRQYSFSGFGNSPNTYIWGFWRWDGCRNASGKCVAPSICL
jgi:hypothetical protein